MTIASGVRTSALRAPGKVALREGARTLTYGQLQDRMNQVSTAAKHDLGLRHGDRVMLLAPNCLEYVEIVAGFAAAGAAVATINSRQTAREIEGIWEDCSPRVLIAHSSVAETARAAELEGIERLIVIGKDYDDWLSKAAPEEPVETPKETDAFAISYTSGTTGKPKGIVLSHRSRVMTFLAMASEYGCYGPDDTHLAFAPMFHGGGFAFAMATAFLGGCCEIMPVFDPELVLQKLSSGAFDSTFMVPTHFHAIFRLDEAVLARYGRPPIRSLVSNAAPLPQATKERIVEYFGEGLLHETYGSTEAGCVTNLRPADQLRKVQCVGQPFPCNRIRLLDDDGQDVARGEFGELFSNSPYLFNGYWNKPDETAAAIRDGWVSAGDMARQDEDGYIYIVDRKKDMIISGGVNIYPREVEEALMRHTGVREVAVVGVADEYWGEKVKAFVVTREGEAPSDAELIDFGKESLASHKVPKEVAFIEALPRNPAGKVLKRELRDAG